MTQEQEIPARMERFAATFGEQHRGVQAVMLPLGHPDAIKRLAHDLIAFGYGMGEAAPQSDAQFGWFEQAETARKRLFAHVEALAAAAPTREPGTR